MTDLEHLRLLIDERIPSGKTEEDTLFTDAELQAILSEANNDLYSATAKLWMIKAGIVEHEIQSYKIGEESITYQKLQERYSKCVELANHYANQAKSNSVAYSTAYKIQKPDVLHEEDNED